MTEAFKQLLLDNRTAKAEFETIKGYLQRVADRVNERWPASKYPRDGGLRARAAEIEAFLLKRHEVRA